MCNADTTSLPQAIIYVPGPDRQDILDCPVWWALAPEITDLATDEPWIYGDGKVDYPKEPGFYRVHVQVMHPNDLNVKLHHFTLVAPDITLSTIIGEPGTKVVNE